MINSYGYDVEVLPNFFSITIVDITSYLKIFSESKIIDKKGKDIPIPLIQKYTVEEIKSKLSKVKKYQFYITDTDDSQLLSMVGFINEMYPHYDEQKHPIRSDMFGYNSSKYDRLMVAALLMYVNQSDSTKELITKLYETSKKIIDSQNNPEIAKHDYFITSLRNYKIPYIDIDVMTIFALNKVGKGKNSKGETIYFGKGLKQTSINLQWYELLEYELPPISNLDIHLYNKKEIYKNMSCEEINQLINKWDRYIINEWINNFLYYNLNDVFIVCEIVRLYIDEIKLRYNISKSYNVDVLSSSRSNIADKLFIKFYSEFSGLSEKQWRGRSTERTSLSFKRIIFPFIKFKTTECKELLEEMKRVVIYSIGKEGLKNLADKDKSFKYLKSNNDTGWFEIKLNNLIYTIATGGLHTQDIPRDLKSKIIYNPSFTGDKTKEDNIWDNITDNSYIYVHFDIASFYPSLMSIYKIAPKHIDQKCFTKLITWLKETRVKAKHSKEDYIDDIPKDILAQVLKIVINSIYGKLGFSKGDLYDRLAVLQVTINGQLLMLMLCEELELNNIEIISANTDGIVVKLYKKDKNKFDEITNEWKSITKLEADSEEYKCYIARDINNYLIEELNGKISYKGALNPTMYAVDLQKGYNMPVVAKAVSDYFIYNKPILESLYDCKNILDFCITQNVGSQFHVEYTINSKTNIMQRNVRFYVANKGGNIEKVHNLKNERTSLCSGQKVIVLNSLNDERIEFRNINYSFYYNEAYKIIDPIKLQISPKQKGGKVIIKKYSHQYNTLFDDLEDETER